MITETFNIVIAYENFDGASRANEIATHLAARVAPKIGISCKTWKFEILGNQKLREQAVTGASQADMVIIAATGGADLPTYVKTWLESWLLQKKGGSASLVALLDQPTQIHGDLHTPSDYLRHLAEAGRLDFFCQTSQRPLEVPFESSHREAMPPAFRVNNYRGWGIND